MVDILTIENDIVTALSTIETGVSGVFYKETVDGLVSEKTGDNIIKLLRGV